MSDKNSIQYTHDKDDIPLKFCSVNKLLQYLQTDTNNSIMKLREGKITNKSTDSNINNKFLAVDGAISKLYEFFIDLESIFNDNNYQDTYFAELLGHRLDDQSDSSFQWFDKSYFIHGELFNKTLDEIYTINNLTLTTATNQAVLQELLNRLIILQHQLSNESEISKEGVELGKTIICVIKEAIISIGELYFVYPLFEKHINSVISQPEIEAKDNVTDNLEEFISVEVYDCDENGKMAIKEIVMTRKAFNNLPKTKS